ncbi:MAG TPA: DUF4389 domain-containing protein [Nocardioidaceae bacterium]
MSTSVYPVHVDAELDRHLSRWLWLVKWAMAIPHYIVLAFLWTAFVLLSAVALVAIVATGRYPRTIFDFNVGVLRWSWRVAYYTYGALATDRYPPFTLDEVPDYPAHLTVDYPEHLSRGLVLVKWWLLAIPHYLVVAIFAGGGLYVAWDTAQGDPDRWTWGGGLIGLLALFAALVLLFTGRYPQQIFDIVLGLNRWVLRVAAYAGLMTDDYPPFRLDLGGHDPHDVAAARVAVPAGPAPGAVTAAPGAGAVSAGEVPPQPAAAGEAQAQPPTQAQAAPAPAWGTGRIVTVVIGAIVFLVAGALLTGGAVLGVGGATMRNDQGFLMSPNQSVATGTYAVATEPVTIEGAWSDVLPEAVLGDVAVRARAGGGEELFVGVAPTTAVEEYLSGTAFATVVRVEDVGGTLTPVYRESDGGAPATLPSESDIWAASSTGTGEQQLSWEPTTGDWTVVVMNADGGAGVTADVAVGAEMPVLGWVVLGMLVAGGLLLLVSVALVLAALYAGRPRREETS